VVRRIEGDARDDSAGGRRGGGARALEHVEGAPELQAGARSIAALLPRSGEQVGRYPGARRQEGRAAQVGERLVEAALFAAKDAEVERGLARERRCALDVEERGLGLVPGVRGELLARALEDGREVDRGWGGGLDGSDDGIRGREVAERARRRAREGASVARRRPGRLPARTYAATARGPAGCSDSTRRNDKRVRRADDEHAVGAGAPRPSLVTIEAAAPGS
jgi:hypothetical protein